MPIEWYPNKSPCIDCEFREQDKKTYAECINCEKRFGGGTHFKPDSKGHSRKKKKERNCTWPHGCAEKTYTSGLCDFHNRLRKDRERRYRRKGMTKEMMEPLLLVPIRKGPNKDSLEAIQEFDRNLG